MLARSEPETFFWTPHHDKSPPLLLVGLERVSDEVLTELLEESYALAGGRR